MRARTTHATPTSTPAHARSHANAHTRTHTHVHAHPSDTRVGRRVRLDMLLLPAFEGGWFHSGDLAVVHENGYIEIRDRAKDIIISGGENISTVEVEVRGHSPWRCVRATCHEALHSSGCH
jgi:acyl-CoA synthetase (AMP-forming)/AMP-acid ligase II